MSKLKVGLEATGHYSYNLLGFLIDKGLVTIVTNPLRTNLYRRSLSLRKTKTDKVFVCLWEPPLAVYLAKKRAEGKHHNIAISHAAKKLVRLIFALERSRASYQAAV